MASLFQACKAAVRNKQGGTFNIGGYDIDIEMYSQQDIQDDIQYGDVTFGDSDESKIVLVAGNTITIPEGYTLTPDKPKKSLVIFCNELINNGTISMYQKAPNVLPHDFNILEGKFINANRDVIIPAYANNETTDTRTTTYVTVTDAIKLERKGQDGVNRQCGAGGLGMASYWNAGSKPNPCYNAKSGSGYAFGGGAGSGSGISNTTGEFTQYCTVDSTYPMRGGAGKRTNYYPWNIMGGVGNPTGETSAPNHYSNNFGCGGRIIIFCKNFTNNGIIDVNGTDVRQDEPAALSSNAVNKMKGGASGAGAVDIFYYTLNEQGTITATGGKDKFNSTANNMLCGYAGAGGDGSVTLTQWNLDKIIKEERKMFTKDNWVYLFNNYSQRLREDVI